MQFGLVICVAGFVGVVGGWVAAIALRVLTTDADAIICAFSLISATPFLFLSFVFSTGNVVWVIN